MIVFTLVVNSSVNFTCLLVDGNRLVISGMEGSTFKNSNRLYVLIDRNS